ncbi:MAG TPA: hypothetical protein VHW69_17650, partial [Rhizomicrobium sp.]|nr:hypothetical protein [Rhizomicrobium sp.]
MHRLAGGVAVVSNFTVIVSPFVPPGTRFRAAGAVPYDHTSIIATLRNRFPALGGPLTQRDAG